MSQEWNLWLGRTMMAYIYLVAVEHCEVESFRV